jgi:hypothetical protein
MKTLIKTELGHIQGYGRLSDVFGETIMGIKPEEYSKYDRVWEEFTIDESLSKHCLGKKKPKSYEIPYTEIPRGTLRIYGEKNA